MKKYLRICLHSLLLIVLSLSSEACLLFQKSVKIKPISFNYQAIGANYFTPRNDKPFPLTIQRGNNLYNSTTKDGRYLFYATNKEGNFDIWFRDLNSSVVVPVTEHPSQEYKPAISPDGSKLVFVSEQYDSDGDLILLDMEPSEWAAAALKGDRFINQRFQVLTNPDYKNQNIHQKVVDTDPAWMPDGERIVYSSDRFSPGVQNLVLMNLKNRDKLVQLTSDGGSSPFASFDGKKIYYLSYRDSITGEIYSLDMDTKEITRLTENNYLNFSPSVSRDNRYLYYTSIRKDTNKNSILDERDNSYIIQLDLKSRKEQFLSSGDTSIFDTRYSEFNGGSVLFSASFYNAINVYFIPYTGSIPKQESIIEQFNYALEYESTNSEPRYFLALDSVELFYGSDPLYPIYRARRDAKKYQFYLKQNSKDTKDLLFEMSKRQDPQDSLSVAYSIYLDPSKEKLTDIKIRELIDKLSQSTLDDSLKYQIKASLLHLLADWQESKGRYKEMLVTLSRIQEDCPDYHSIRDVKNRYGVYEFQPDSIRIPKFYLENIAQYERLMQEKAEVPIPRRMEIKDLLLDLDNKIRSNKIPKDILTQIDAIRNHETYPKDSLLLNNFLTYLQAEALRSDRKIEESSQLLDSIIPIPQAMELDPIGQKSIFELPEFINIYKNPTLTYIHLLRYKNAQSLGNGSLALRNLRIFMEFYDPFISPELDEEEFSRLFLYWENKAIEFERLGDLQQAAFHYYFNNLGMSLAKSKNISVDKFYGSYAVYYQRKMIDTIFRHGLELRQKEEAAILNRINILSEDNLDVLGNLQDAISFVQKIPLLDALKILGDFRDFRNKDVIHENALLLSDQYFNYHLEKNRPFLNLAVVYGYAYYLINKSVLNETAQYKTGSMTKNKKKLILENYKKAEYELRWILFADPTFPDAYQLLGWLYQYIDIIKSKKVDEDGPSEEERYESVYKMYFPEKNFEENVELYTQILEFLGKEYPNKKILSDLNLNLGNNFFLLSNYPKANEAGNKVEEYGDYIVAKSQFDDYKQEAVFRYNYGRSALYRADYQKAIQEFEHALKIYTKNEYYQTLMNRDSSKQGQEERTKEFVEVKSKLALLNALIGLSRMEMGEFEESIAPLQSAISHNRIGGEIDSLNLWNSLAIAYQKTGRFKESRDILDKADEEYTKQKSNEPWFQFSASKYFWSIFLSDQVRVMGDGRFPGEFPIDFKNLLTRSIRINNFLEERDYGKAIEELDKRDKFINKFNLKKWEMGKLVSQQTFALKGYAYFDSENYLQAADSYKNMESKFRDSSIVSRERIALLRKSYSVFSLAESSDELMEVLNILEDNLEYLLDYRLRSMAGCPKDETNICTEKFRKDFRQYEVILGLNYFYLGEVYKNLGDLDRSFLHYGRSLAYLKNPSNVEARFIMLPKDPFTKKERIRNSINLARLYLRLADLREANRILKEAKEYAYEFRLERELFQIELVEYELESFRPYQPGKKKALDAGDIVKSLVQRYKKEEYLSWQILPHTTKEFFEIQNRHSMLIGKPWEVPHQRDVYRNRILSNQVILSSLEYKNLPFNQIAKNYQKESKNLVRVQNDLELKAMNRNPVDSLLKKKANILERLKSHRMTIAKEYPEYSKFYELELKNQNYSLANDSASIRCLDLGGKLSYWARFGSSRIFKQFESNSGSQNILSEIEGINQKNIFINPDNCNFLYNTTPFNSDQTLTYVTKEGDVQGSKTQEGIDWRWKTVLVDDSDQEDKLRLKYSNSSLLGPSLLDTDLLFVTNPKLELKQPLLSHLTPDSLNIREILTEYSETEAIVLEADTMTADSYKKAGMIWDLLTADKHRNIILTSPMSEKDRLQLTKTNLPNNSIVFGTILKKNEVSNPDKKYREIRVAAISQERAKAYSSAYDLYYDAGSYLDEGSKELVLENELDLARMKRRLFPDLPPDRFFKPLIRTYKEDQNSLNKVYTVFLRDCFSDRTIQKNRSLCETYYTDWQNLNPEASQYIDFYYKLYKGETRNIDVSLNKSLEVKGDDEFLRNVRISDLFLENFLFEESWNYADFAEEYTRSAREKNIIDARKLEIQYHRAFLEGITDFSYNQVNANSTYAMGFKRDWTKFQDKVYSEAFQKLGDSDSIYDEYRKRLYQKWMDWEFGKEFEPSALIPDELYEGGSVLSKMTHLNRGLYFYLLNESSKHQLYSEADTLVDALIQEEGSEGFHNRALAYSLYYADQLIRNGDLDSAKNYVKDFEAKYDTKTNFHPLLEKKYAYLIFKLSSYKEDVAFLDSAKSILDKDDSEIYSIFKEIRSVGPGSFDKILNQYINQKKSKNQGLTPYKRKKLEDLIQYMMKVSFDYDSSEGFLDSLHYRHLLAAYNERTIGSKPYFKDLPRINSVASGLTKKLPAGQELHAIGDYLNKTYLITVSNGKTKGRELFTDTRGIRANLRKYHLTTVDGGAEPRLRDILEDRYRNSIRFPKDRINYLFLSDYHLNIPLIQKTDIEVYQVQNLESLIENRPIPRSSTAWGQSSIHKYRETKFNPTWYQNLKSIEDWELKFVNVATGSKVNISQEEARVDESGTLLYGGVPISKVSKVKTKRTTPWMTSSNFLGSAYILSLNTNHFLYHVDSIHIGAGIISLEDQSDFYNSYFMKQLTISRPSSTELRYRFMDARKLLRERYPFDKYWHGYRIYTTSFILP